MPGGAARRVRERKSVTRVARIAAIRIRIDDFRPDRNRDETGAAAAPLRLV
jgi:hypothetical protein